MRKAMKYSIWDGMAANMSENMFGPFLALFALALGASKAQIGLFSSLPALLGNIVQIPAAVITERLGRRKLICILGGIGSRLAILVVFLIPFFNLDSTAVVVLIAAIALRGLVGSLGVPAWTAIMADITPRSARGGFFSTRNILASLTGLGGTLAAGWIIRTYGFPRGYQWSFLAAFFLGLLSLYFFSRIPVTEPASRKRAADAAIAAQGSKISADAARISDPPESFSRKLHRFVQALATHRNFRKYCLTSVLWGFSVSLGGPLVAVYFSETLKGTAAQWSICSAAGLIATMVGQRYWGRLTDRFGPKNVMAAGGIGAASVPLLWLAIPVPEVGFVASFIGSFGWGGYNLAAFNFLLELTPEENRPTFVGVYNTLVGVTTSIAPLIGGILADLIGMRYVLLLSGILRFTSYFVFVRSVENTSGIPMHPKDLIPGLPRLRHRCTG